MSFFFTISAGVGFALTDGTFNGFAFTGIAGVGFSFTDGTFNGVAFTGIAGVGFAFTDGTFNGVSFTGVSFTSAVGVVCSFTNSASFDVDSIGNSFIPSDLSRTDSVNVSFFILFLALLPFLFFKN